MTGVPRPTPDELARLSAAAPRAPAVAALLGVSRATALHWLPRGPHPQSPRHPWKRGNDRP